MVPEGDSLSLEGGDQIHGVRSHDDQSALCCRPTERDSYTRRSPVATPHTSTAQSVVAS